MLNSWVNFAKAYMESKTIEEYQKAQKILDELVQLSQELGLYELGNNKPQEGDDEAGGDDR